jgi:hypothetical protein
MNVLDENIPADQVDLLGRWRIRTRQIGQDLGRQGMKDENEIIPLLLQLSRPTFFTRDLGFFEQRLCHPGYCLVGLAVSADEAASFIRRALRHPELETHARRLGKVIELQHSGILVIEKSAATATKIEWP